MSKDNPETPTFVEMVLALLEDRFPWLGNENEAVSGADAIEELNHLHQDLIERRDQARP
ncbi:hypothetical protein ACFPT7_07150 [Acidicapsa dinghuensis]|uniref:Uncharacterized protein n=1 Tax=Acidicapsa dinghuensis TaxID=2218256 RepID=A0ABW1EDL8_9BACT|nr:hypothetical protein [Acidicapsa dinghuensis]